MRPHFGQIEWIKRRFGRLFGCHHLNIERPRRMITVRNRIVQIADGIVGIGAGQRVRFLHVQILDSLVGFVVEFAENWFTLRIDQLESVRSVAVHVPVPVWNTPIGEQEHHLMNCLRPERHKVPEHVRVLQVRLGVAFLGVDEWRKQDRITDEKDGSVVTDQIPDAIFRVEFDSESSGIANGVGRARLTAHCRESDGDRGLFADRVEHLGGAVLADVVGDFEVAERARPLRMDDSFGDAFAIEVGEGVDKGDVLQEDGTPMADGDGGVLFGERGAMASSGGVGGLEKGGY